MRTRAFCARAQPFRPLGRGGRHPEPHLERPAGPPHQRDPRVVHLGDLAQGFAHQTRESQMVMPAHERLPLLDLRAGSDQPHRDALH